MLHFSQAKNCTENLQISFRVGVYESLMIAFQKMSARIRLSLFGRAEIHKRERGADGAAGAGIRAGSTGPTGSWLPRVPHQAPLTFIYLFIK